MSSTPRTSAELLARYFLYLASQEREPSPLTQMYVHKLLYYAQGWALATAGRAVFESRIEAWKNGPVVPEVYPVFKSYKRGVIPESEAIDGSTLSADDRAIAQMVWRSYRGYSASGLRNRTHRELPWKSARGRTPEGESSKAVITHSSLKEFFSSEFDRRCGAIGVDAKAVLGAREDCRSGKAVSWEQLKQELLARNDSAQSAAE